MNIYYAVTFIICFGFVSADMECANFLFNHLKMLKNQNHTTEPQAGARICETYSKLINGESACDNDIISLYCVAFQKALPQAAQACKVKNVALKAVKTVESESIVVLFECRITEAAKQFLDALDAIKDTTWESSSASCEEATRAAAKNGRCAAFQADLDCKKEQLEKKTAFNSLSTVWEFGCLFFLDQDKIKEEKCDYTCTFGTDSEQGETASD